MFVDILDGSAVLGEPGLLAEWKRLLPLAGPRNRMFASPIWFEHTLRNWNDSEPYLATVRDSEGRLAGACPFKIRDVALPLAVGGRTLARFAMRAIVVMGSEVLLSGPSALHAEILDGILSAFPTCQCIYLYSVPPESPTWLSIRGRPPGSRRFFRYTPELPRPLHWIDFGASFDDYLSAKSGKTRSSLRRKVRSLGLLLGHTPELKVYEAAHQVGEFLEAATHIESHSWQARTAGRRVGVKPDATAQALMGLADGGILRSYVLTCGGTSCAFAIGYQFEGVFEFGLTGYEEAIAHASPGTVLLFLMLDDLFARNPPAMFHFGYADGVYKRRFGNRESTELSAYLFKRTWSNAFKCASHRALLSGKRLARTLGLRYLLRTQGGPVRN